MTDRSAGRSPHDRLDWAIGIVTTGGMYLSALVMAGLFGAGLVESGTGAFYVLKSAVIDGHQSSYGTHVTKIIHGLELLLIAPVAFLIFDSLNTYLPRPAVKEQNPEKAEVIRALRKEEAHAKVLRVKGFITGLLFALIATTLVGQALSATLTLEGAAAAGVILAILGAYFIALERVAVARRT